MNLVGISPDRPELVFLSPSAVLRCKSQGKKTKQVKHVSEDMLGEVDSCVMLLKCGELRRGRLWHTGDKM